MTNSITAGASMTKPSIDTHEIIQLIDGTFGSSEAREVLLAMINHKIRFHKVKNFSSEERYGKPHELSCKRIDELTKDSQRLLEILDFAAQNGFRVDLKSKIEIRLQ